MFYLTSQIRLGLRTRRSSLRRQLHYAGSCQCRKCAPFHVNLFSLGRVFEELKRVLYIKKDIASIGQL
jgi:hypothetical protein